MERARRWRRTLRRSSVGSLSLNLRGQLLVDGLMTGQQSIGHDLSSKLVQLVDVQVLLLRGGTNRQQLGVAWIFLESLLLHRIDSSLKGTQIFLSWRRRRSSGHHIWTTWSAHVGTSRTGHSLARPTRTSRLHLTWWWWSVLKSLLQSNPYRHHRPRWCTSSAVASCVRACPSASKRTPTGTRSPTTCSAWGSSASS